jgi:hypothetical protein
MKDATIMLMANRVSTLFLMGLLLWVQGCLSGEEAFVDGRLHAYCDEAYWLCNKPAGCVLDSKHYIRGDFPGARRFVVVTEANDVTLEISIYIATMEAPGTELIVQAYEPGCTLNTEKSQAHMEDVDIFKKAGDDRVLQFDLFAQEAGEHLIEVYSDASADYLVVVKQK